MRTEAWAGVWTRGGHLQRAAQVAAEPDLALELVTQLVEHRLTGLVARALDEQDRVLLRHAPPVVLSVQAAGQPHSLVRKAHARQQPRLLV